MADNPINRDPRLMFLLNNDYGELGLAMYFLQGRELVKSSTVLLPPRLFASNRETLPCATREYASIEDIISMVDTIKPDIFFLFSGYILPNHGLLSLEEMDALVKLLVDRNITVSTSDPFFGIFSHMDASHITGPESLRLFETDLLPDLTWQYRAHAMRGNFHILSQFAIASDILKDTVHLYYCCPDPDDGPMQGSDHQAAFFNPSLIEADQGAASSEDPHWLYILGSVDYELQTQLFSETEFLNIVARHLKEALDHGRRCVLLAPRECIQKLRSRVPVSARKDLLEFCAYEKFTSLLLDAEYVFYWNLASYSTFLRVINKRPMFMFDGGHLVRHVKPMAKTMGHSYYQNWTPPFLDPHEPLDIGVLEELSEAYRNDTQRIVKNLEALPSPEQVIEGLLSS